MDKRNKWLLKNIGLFSLSEFGSKALVFLLLPFYTYFLSNEEYAIIDLIQVTINLILPIITFSIYESVLKYILDKSMTSSTGLSSGLCVVCLSNIAVGLAILMPIYGEYNKYRLFFFLAFFSLSFQILFSYFARAIDSVKDIAISSIISTLITALLNIFLISCFKLGINGYFIALISGNIFKAIFLFFKGKFFIYISCRYIDKNSIFKMLSFSVPLIPNALFWWINTSVDKYCLTFMTSLAIVGIYSVAGKVPSIINVVSSIFNSAWRMSAIKEEGTEGSNFFYENTFEIFSVFLSFVAFVLIGMSRIIAHFMYLNSSFSAWRITPILVIGVYIDCLNTFIGSLFAAKDNTKLLFSTTLIGSIVNITLNLAFIPLFGGIGAAIATSASHVTVLIIRSRKAKKQFNFNPNIVYHILRFIICVVLTIIMIMNYKVAYIIFVPLLLLLICFSQNQINPLIAILKNRVKKK